MLILSCKAQLLEPLGVERNTAIRKGDPIAARVLDADVTRLPRERLGCREATNGKQRLIQ
jgi:hypothetical protein